MPMHNFSLIGGVLLHFILQVEVVEISLQIINRYGKRKGILNNKTDYGPKPGRKPSPAQQPPPSPHSGVAQRGPAEAACPSRSERPGEAFP
jgi:hypothetical protein